MSFQFDEEGESVVSEIRGLFEELQRRKKESHNELRAVASVNVHYTSTMLTGVTSTTVRYVGYSRRLDSAGNVVGVGKAVGNGHDIMSPKH